MTPEQIAADMTRRIAKQLGRPQDRVRVIIGPNGWMRATLHDREADNGR
jgi:phenylpyruvate tautomerase PptA (4-oxalocrotonate tautomerase family)